MLNSVNILNIFDMEKVICNLFIKTENILNQTITKPRVVR